MSLTLAIFQIRFLKIDHSDVMALDPCPLGGQCLQGPMVYKATVTTKESNPISKTYHGMTGGTFKKRYGGHKSDFKHKDKYGTTLSRHIWRLRDMNVKYSIKWEIKEKAPI